MYKSSIYNKSVKNDSRNCTLNYLKLRLRLYRFRIKIKDRVLFFKCRNKTSFILQLRSNKLWRIICVLQANSILTGPSGSCFMQFQASTRLMRAVDSPLMLRISSPVRTWLVFWAAPPAEGRDERKRNELCLQRSISCWEYLPTQTLVTTSGRLPSGESNPPSMAKPRPQLSLMISTQRAPLPVEASSIED